MNSRFGETFLFLTELAYKNRFRFPFLIALAMHALGLSNIQFEVIFNGGRMDNIELDDSDLTVDDEDDEYTNDDDDEEYEDDGEINDLTVESNFQINETSDNQDILDLPDVRVPENYEIYISISFGS